MPTRSDLPSPTRMHSEDALGRLSMSLLLLFISECMNEMTLFGDTMNDADIRTEAPDVCRGDAAITEPG